MTAPVAFLFLGETLLIPHLFPIAEALAARGVSIDLWVSTSVHEGLLGRWVRGDHVRIRRAPGFKTVDHFGVGRNPVLPSKPLMLARLVPHLWRTKVVVCAEQTSLWLPTLLPMPARFVKTAHGAGSMMARADHRRRSPWLTLVPAEQEKQALARHGVDPARIAVTGYVKAAFRHRTPAKALFADQRPIILYNPHWQGHRSSWPAWGEGIVAALAAQERFNVILAPHQRLVETAPEMWSILKTVSSLPHVHCDVDSFAMVDGSYAAAADLYLGDTSSQVVEFMARPRPCVFLNPWRARWREDPSYAQWQCGQVVEQRDEVMAAIERAQAVQDAFTPVQQAFAAASLGDISGAAPERAAELILRLVEARSG